MTVMVPATGVRPAVPTSVRIGVLGALTVSCCDSTVAIRRGRPRILLASLVLHRGRPVPSDTLVEHLWGDALPTHPANALQTQMAYVRRMLGGTAVAPITTRPEGYVLESDRIVVDVDCFEWLLGDGRRLAAGGRERDLGDALAAYDDALALWRGQPYTELTGRDTADAERVRLEEIHLTAQEERCELLLGLGRTADAIATAAALVSDQPLRERRSELLVLALYRDGRQADALREYERTRRTLADELGIEPGPRLRSLERQVLAHDAALEWRRPPPAHAESLLTPSTPTAAPAGELVGRDAEIARIRQLLAERRCITLTGPGGAGKTRLAWAVVEGIGRPSHVVDLAAVTDPEAVLAAITSTIGVRPAPGADDVDALVTALAGAGPILVLDTCERVLDGVAPIVERLLAADRDLSVLATSRRPLGLGDELAWPVPPLPVPASDGEAYSSPAMELFERRARAVAPDFRIDAELATIGELCRSLDGLPLAIELAAAQMDVLTPSAVLAQLGERRTLAGRSGGPERHRTLGAATDWSIGLLTEPERDLLHRLAVLPATFDLDTAIAIAAEPDRAIDLFLSLVRSSLVAPADTGRFRLLDTIRAHLTTTDGDDRRRHDANRRLATHVAGVAGRAFDGVRGAEQRRWLECVRTERAQIDTVLAWCFGDDGDAALGAQIAGHLAWAWTLLGRLDVSLPVLERAAAVDAAPLVRARAHLGVALLASPLGNHSRARDACHASAAIGEELGDAATVAAAELTLGVAEWAAGDLERAAATHARAIGRFDALADPWGATICRTLRARTLRDLGRADEADALLDAAIEDAAATGDGHVIGLVYEQVARSALARGDLARAAAAVEVSLERCEELSHPEGIVAALGLAAAVRLAAGDADEAGAMHRRALGLAFEIGHVGAMCASLASLAEIDAAVGSARRATVTSLVVRRARARRGLTPSPEEQHRSDQLLDRLRTELGIDWDAAERAAALQSLREHAATVLGGGVGRG